MGRINYSYNADLSLIANRPLHRYTTRTMDSDTVNSLMPDGRQNSRSAYSINHMVSQQSGVSEGDLETRTSSGGGVSVIVLTDSDFATTLTLYRGSTYRWTGSGADNRKRMTVEIAETVSNSVKWIIGANETVSDSDYTTTITIGETIPDQMYWYNGDDTTGNITIAYPTDRALPTNYKIRWLDPVQLFPAKIDRDNIDAALVRIESLFTARRPISEDAGLHYDTTMTLAANPSINSAATGGPTASDYSGLVFSGWTEAGTVTFKATGDLGTVAGNDGLYDDAGIDRGFTRMTMLHETLHAIGIGSSFSIIGRNYNGNTGLMIKHPTDPGTEGSENYLWTGSNAVAWYKSFFGSAISSDVEGVPMKAGDSSHWDDSTTSGRALERTINGKTYLGIWDEVVTASGGDYITGFTAGALKDVGLPIDMSNVETPPVPTLPKTWAFDVGAGLTLTANTDVYTNVYSATSLSGTNPELRIEPGDVVKLNILAGGATVNVYSNTSTGTMEWSPLSTGVTSGTITVAPTSSNTTQWLYNSVFYASGSNQGKITVNDITYDEGRDHDNDGVYNNRDQQSVEFTPEYTRFTGSAVTDANMLWQGSSYGYYTANTSTATNFPMYRGSLTDSEPWALSAVCTCGRRQAGWDTTTGIVLLNTQGGADGNVVISTHENKDTGAFYAKFKYGTSSNGVEITTSNITYNNYYTGFYVDYDGASGFRMFTYDYYSNTLTQASNVIVTGSIGLMRAANFEVAKTPGASRYWNGRISQVTVTTLRTGVVLPSNAEILSMIKTPDVWLSDYKEGNAFRLPGATSDDTTSISPTALSLSVTAGTYFNLSGTLVYTQGSYSSPNLGLSKELARGSVYEIEDLSGKELRLSTSSAYHISLAAAQANIYSSNITYAADTITISAGDDTPDYLYLFDNLGSTPRDGPINFTGSGYPVAASETAFTKRTFGGSDTTAVQKSAQSTKVYFFTGNIAGGPGQAFPTEKFVNEVSYDATEHFLVNN